MGLSQSKPHFTSQSVGVETEINISGITNSEVYETDSRALFDSNFCINTNNFGERCNAPVLNKQHYCDNCLSFRRIISNVDYERQQVSLV